MGEFNAGDRVRIIRDLADVIVCTRIDGGPVSAGSPEYRLGATLLGTVLTSGTLNGHVHLEWDADEDGGPYEDEYEADGLAVVNPVDAHYLDLAARVDAIVGPESSFLPELVMALWGDISEMVDEYIADNESEGYEVEETREELEDTLREGRVEVLVDDMSCYLHPHGYYLGRDDDGLHVLVEGPVF